MKTEKQIKERLAYLRESILNGVEYPESYTTFEMQAFKNELMSLKWVLESEFVND